MDELQAKHKKELKSFDGEKRGAVKKAKATAGKGKKGKEALAAIEQEYATKEKEITDRHSAEISALQQQSDGTGGEEKQPATGATDSAAAPSAGEPKEEEDSDEARRKKKQDKARRKKEKAKLKEEQREQEIADELAAAGPTKREMEIAAMKELYLDPLGLVIKDVEADGSCLYRAVAEQCGDGWDFGRVRSACADSLLEHETELAPFAESHDHGSYVAYVERVRNSNDWGGHLELRALTSALKRPVVVYSAEAGPLKLGEEEFGDGDDGDGGSIIRLSFHRHYYALGEHYNSVVPK